MKAFFTFALILSFPFTGHAQSTNNYHQWQHPILQQLRTGSKTLVPFYNIDSTAFVTASVIDKKQKIIYWFDCYGYYFDAVPITDNNIQAIATKRITAFKYYDLITTEYLKIIIKARTNFQNNGNAAKFTAYEKQLLQIDDSIKFSSTLKKLMELDKQKLSVERQIREFHSVNPKRIKEDTCFSKTLAIQYGSMKTGFQQDTTTTYYNRIALEPVYKAVLNHTDATIAYYNRGNQLVDELQLNKDKVDLLLKEKTDVFLLYRGWLELQRFYVLKNITAIKTSMKEFSNNQTNNKSQFVSSDNSFQSLLDYNNALLKNGDYKINYLTTIDRGFVSQCLKKQYEQSTDSVTAGEAYSSTFTRGNKLYELTDARGNVVEVVSDKKIQHSSDGTTVDYYEPDIVAATDYAPFGSTLVGRNYQSDKYRYGFNGKENDNEVKGEGNQLDYGMRIYDPRLGRFLSVDPIAPKYPQLTPYQFSSNRPIDGIDLDGLEWTVETKNPDPNNKGGKTEVSYTIKISLADSKNTMQLSNPSDKETLSNIAKRASEILSNLNATGTKDDPIVKVNIEFTDAPGDFKVNFRPFYSFQTLDPKTGKLSNSGDPFVNGQTLGGIGETQKNLIEVATSNTLVFQSPKMPSMRSTVDHNDIEEIARTLSHELGHSAGLFHPFDSKNDIPEINNNLEVLPLGNINLIKDNLMNTEQNPVEELKSNKGKNLIRQQRQKIKSTVESQQPKKSSS